MKNCDVKLKKPSKTPAKVSPIILDKCLALIKIANIDAAADVKENLMHNANTAVNAKELKNEKASNIPVSYTHLTLPTKA